jgi:hypothetical protein
VLRRRPLRPPLLGQGPKLLPPSRRIPGNAFLSQQPIHSQPKGALAWGAPFPAPHTRLLHFAPPLCSSTLSQNERNGTKWRSKVEEQSAIAREKRCVLALSWRWPGSFKYSPSLLQRKLSNNSSGRSNFALTGFRQYLAWSLCQP